MKKIISSLVALCMVLAMGSVAAFAAAPETAGAENPVIIGEFDGLLSDCQAPAIPETADAEEPIIIGEFDGLLAECLDPDTPMPLILSVANVRINSYATYDSRNGVQVTVKLYVPWYEFPKPQFTGMAGDVIVNLNNRSTSTHFVEFASGDETISSDVDTGRTATSGTRGTINVEGVATALNALTGGGVFAIGYEITIP